MKTNSTTEKQKTMPTSVRFSPIVKELIRLERAESGAESDNDYLEQLVLSSVKTEKGRTLLKQHLRNSPMIRAYFDGAGIKMDFNLGLAC